MADEQIPQPIEPLVVKETVNPVPDRGPRGLFAKGNKLGKGNQSALLAQKYRAQWDKCIKTGQIKQIYNKLYELAIAGDLVAIKLYLEYSMGKPRSDTTIELGGPENQTISIQV